MFDKACPLNISILLDRKSEKKTERNHDSEKIDWSLIGRWLVSDQQTVVYLPLVDHIKR